MIATQADVPLAMSFIISLSYPNGPVGVVDEDIAIGSVGCRLDFWAGTGR